MSYSEVIEETATHRVRLALDESPQNPREDGDYHLVGVVTVYGGRYLDVADPAGDERVQEAWRRLDSRYDWREAQRMLERYVRILGGVSLYDSPGDGPNSLWYVLPDKWAEVTLTPWDAGKALDAVKVERDEYRSWAEGDVYGYIVEERAETVLVRFPGTDRETREEGEDWTEVESCWGFIGREWAEQAAREALANESGVTA